MENIDDFSNQFFWILPVAVVFVLLVLQVFKIMREYERAVVFRLGKYQGTKGPGLIFLLPFIDKIQRVDLRVLTFNVDKQEVITKDNVTVNVDAITFFRDVNAEAAVIQEEKFIYVYSILAQHTSQSTEDLA